MQKLDDYMETFPIRRTKSLQESTTLGKERHRPQSTMQTYCQVQKIIDQRTTEDGEIEYYVKWKRLEHSHCSWESAKTLPPQVPMQRSALTILGSTQRPIQSTPSTTPRRKGPHMSFFATALLIHQLISIVIAVGRNIPFRLSLLLYRLRRVTCCNIVEIRNSPKTVPVRASTRLA